jgi:ligand-binding sensor domain-containing protein/serine phosphatase RsbU (regulator of sigma subunit)
MKISFILLAVWMGVIGVNGQDLQNLKFKHLSSKNGLPNNSITNIFKDSKGFMWLGSEEGLYRYDGYDYITYKNDESDSHSISGNYIWYIYEDKDRNLWIANNNCLNLYNRDRDYFERYYINNDPQNKSIIYHLFEDSKKNFWIGTSNGLIKFDRKNRTFQQLLPEFKDNLSIRTITEDKNGILWMGGDNEEVGLIKFDGIKVLQIFKTDSKNKNSLSSNYIYSLAADKYNNIWIGNLKTGVDKFDLSKQTFVNCPNDKGKSFLNSSHINRIAIDRYNNVWLATVDGLNIIEFKTNKVHIYTSKPDDENSILSNNYWCNYIDNEGIVWLGSRSGGVDMYDPRFTKFLHISASNKSKMSINANTISCFVEDKQGNIWIGTDGGGINFWNRKENTFSYFTADANNHNHLTNNKVLAMMIDQENTLWVGMWDGGINRFKIIDNKLILTKRYEQLIPNVESSSSIFKIYQSRNGSIWIGTWKHGLFLYDKAQDNFTQYPRKDKKVTIYPPSNNQSESLRLLFNENIMNLDEDYIGQVWISTESSGVYMIDNQGNTIHYAYDKSIKNSLRSQEIFFVYQDTKKRVWVGTGGGGLNLLNPDKKTFKAYTTKDGLPHNTIVGMLEDKEGNLWISTNKGIAKITLLDNSPTPKLRCNVFDTNDGLQGDQYIAWATFKNTKGEFFFGGSNGFNVFDPANLNLNTVKPQVYITDIMILNKSQSVNEQNSILKKSILETKEISLTYEQKIITIKFAALNFINSSKNQYMYQLVNFDTDWINSNGKREITYTNLDPGTYFFKVKASNNDGVWNEEGVTLKIIVLPPWWETWWFRTLLIGSIILGAFLFYRWRVRTIEAQKAQLEKLVEERTFELKQKNDEVSQQAEELMQQAEELMTQRDFIQAQNNQLEEKNQQIRQSINAALTIQSAILPTSNDLKNLVGDYFVLYNPKDIVSGDFYWLHQVGNQTIIAAIDCTGHGVPGAFMTLIGNSILDKIVRVLGITDPAQILSLLHQEVYKALKQKETGNNYGMDGVVIALENTVNSQNRAIIYAGAKNSLYYIDNQNTHEVQVIKGTRRAIGGYQNEEIEFVNHTITLSQGSLVYLCSDGYIDQNNPERKRLGNERFIQLIKEVSPLSIEEQALAFKQALEDHMQDSLQRDDILLLGVRV